MTWRCGFCGAVREARTKPTEACTQCGDQQWEETIRGEEDTGVHHRPGS